MYDMTDNTHMNTMPGSILKSSACVCSCFHRLTNPSSPICEPQAEQSYASEISGLVSKKNAVISSCSCASASLKIKPLSFICLSTDKELMKKLTQATEKQVYTASQM